MSVRRLPVYILADCSGSMMGTPIESVKRGIRELHSNLMGDPSAIETAFLSVITFDSSARQLVPLTEVASFNPPELQAGGTTALGAALKTLIDCISTEVRATTPDQKGDWKPLIFLMTDGAPTDNWQQYAEELKRKKHVNIIALACGTEGDVSVLKTIGDTVLSMKDMTPDAFARFFKWVSVSVAQTSAKIGASPDAAAGGVTLPPPPSGYRNRAVSVARRSEVLNSNACRAVNRANGLVTGTFTDVFLLQSEEICSTAGKSRATSPRKHYGDRPRYWGHPHR